VEAKEVEVRGGEGKVVVETAVVAKVAGL